MKQPSSPWALLLVLAVAFTLRLWHILHLEASPFAEVLLGDAAGYVAWAREIAGGDWWGDEVFYQAPLYPYFLALFYAGGVEDLFWIRVAQALMGAAACGFLQLGTARFFHSEAAGLLAGMAMALFAPGIFHDTLIQKSVLDLFFLCLLVWLLSKLLDRPGWLTGMITGAVFGCLVLTRENASVLIVAILPWIFISLDGNKKRGALLAASFLLGIGLTLGPVVVRNYTISGDFHLTTSQMGPNFYIGNHEGATGTYVPLRWGRGSSRFERTDAEELAEIASGRELDPTEMSAYWSSRAVNYIRSHPADWLQLTWLKFGLLWNATEIIDTEDQYTYAEFSPPLHWLGLLMHFGFIAPLALLGVFVTWSQRRRLWIFYAMTGCYAASVLAFYVVARYRLPLAPFLVPFAAAGLVGLGGWLRDTRREFLWIACGVILLFALFTNWNFVDREGMRAATYYNLGMEAGRRNQSREAMDFYRKAIEIYPGQSEALVNLAGELMAAGEKAEAMRLYEQALVVAPGVGAIHGRFATALVEEGRIDEALSHFERSLELEPDVATTHYGMALVLASKRQMQEAFARMETALRLDPELMRRLKAVTWSLAARPSPPGSGQARHALVMARWARSLGDPMDSTTLDLLAVATAANGRYTEAITLTDEAIALAEAQEKPNLVAAFKIHRGFYARGLPFIMRAPTTPAR